MYKRQELAFDAMIGKTNEEIALRMKTLYHDGSGFELDGRRFSVWFCLLYTSRCV